MLFLISKSCNVIFVCVLWQRQLCLFYFLAHVQQPVSSNLLCLTFSIHLPLKSDHALLYVCSLIHDIKWWWWRKRSQFLLNNVTVFAVEDVTVQKGIKFFEGWDEEWRDQKLSSWNQEFRLNKSGRLTFLPCHCGIGLQSWKLLLIWSVACKRERVAM